MDPRRRLRGRSTLCAALLITVPFAAACTGSPSSESAWQSSSHRTLGSVISGLGTARVVVRAEARDDLPHTYAVVAATDAIDTSTKEVASYLVGQPPDRLHRANREVATALQDAVTLLVEVRVALASPGLSGADGRRLVAAIDAMRDRLDELDRTVQESPGSVGSS